MKNKLCPEHFFLPPPIEIFSTAKRVEKKYALWGGDGALKAKYNGVRGGCTGRGLLLGSLLLVGPAALTWSHFTGSGGMLNATQDRLAGRPFHGGEQVGQAYRHARVGFHRLCEGGRWAFLGPSWRCGLPCKVAPWWVGPRGAGFGLATPSSSSRRRGAYDAQKLLIASLLWRSAIENGGGPLCEFGKRDLRDVREKYFEYTSKKNEQKKK